MKKKQEKTKEEPKKVETKVPEPPSAEAEKTLNAIIGNEWDAVNIRGKEWRFRWLRYGAKRKITDIVLNEKNEDKVAVKCVAVAWLNDLWSIKFLYWIVWRWMFYVKQYTYEELIEVTALIKKKAPVAAYLVVTTSLTEMKDTMMAMTRAEVERIHQERLMARLSQLEKSTAN